MSFKTFSISVPREFEAFVHPPNVLSFPLPEDGSIPNNPKCPLLVYPQALDATVRDPAMMFERLFMANDWKGVWRNGVYTFHHYHSNTHEVLGICKGSATLRLGGEHGITQRVRAGDVVIIPAGVSHKNMGASSNFSVVGAYPDGREPDVNYGRPAERQEADHNIMHAPLPKADPIYGPEGPIFQYWGE